MHPRFTRLLVSSFLLVNTLTSGWAQAVRVLTNQVGYESDRPKRAVIVAGKPQSMPTFQLVNVSTGAVVYTGKPVYSGPVDHWKTGVFWTIDFTPVTTEGDYQVRVAAPATPVVSHPFRVGRNVLEQRTPSEIGAVFSAVRLGNRPAEPGRYPAETVKPAWAARPSC